MSNGHFLDRPPYIGYWYAYQWPIVHLLGHWKQLVPCGKCEAEARKREAQHQRDYKLDLQRQANERAYAQRLAELDEEIAHERRVQKEHADQLDGECVLRQRRKDLADARAS